MFEKKIYPIFSATTVYYGGMIKREFKPERNSSNFGVVITSKAGAGGIQVLEYKMDSDEFYEITGPKTPENPLDRVYMGLNDSGLGVVRSMKEEIIKGGDGVLDNLDRQLVNPSCL